MQVVRQLKKNWSILVPGILICAGLLLRDAFDYEINKYIFLILAAYPILCLNIGKALSFISFLIPLYFGLPGNYISILILARFTWEFLKSKHGINAEGIIISIILSLYLLISVLFHDNYNVYNLMGSLDYIILFLFVCLTVKYHDEGGIIFGYAIGTTALGAIMMTATLQHFTFLELMGSATRLGQFGVLQDQVESTMLTTVDPNFYGMFVIALVSSSYLLLKNKCFINKTPLIALSITSVILCLCGLSRTFLLILFLWGVLTAISRGSIKGVISIICIFAIVVFSVMWFFPDMVDAFDNRMNDSTMSGGNGRIRLIEEHFSKWEDSLETLLFGLGLYENNVHCGPLRYLFGIGITGFIILSIWLCTIFTVAKRRCRHISLSQYVPFVLTFIVFSTIPAAGSLNAIFPLIISITAIRL